MQNKIYLSFILIGLIVLNNYGQKKSKSFQLHWKDKTEFAVISTKSNTSTIIPTVEGGSFDHYFLPTYSSSWKVNSNLKVMSFKVKNIVYKTASKKTFHKESQQHFPTKLKSSFEIKNTRNESFAVLNITPLLLSDGILKKIESFEIEYQLTPKTKTKSFSTVHDSPFSFGNWYKFAVDTTGVYKLSRSFIRSLGLNTGVNPKNIKIYGNGGAMLNELNSDFRYDDIQENAIYFSGEEDGSFDSNDYILFYAQGPDIWKHDINNNLATHQTNIYSDKAYYYITVADDLGKRIQTQASINTTPDLTVTTFNDTMLHEKDVLNFDSFGQEFYGESFQIENTQVFTFNFTDLDLTKPINIKMKSGATASCNFTLNIEGQNLFSYFISNPNPSTQVGKTNTGNANFTATNESLNIEVVYDSNNNPSTRAYLDYIEVNGVKNLIARDKQFSFRNYQAASQTGVVAYQIQNSSNIFQIWNVTDKINVSQVSNQSTGNDFSFKTSGGILNEYLILNENDYYEPEIIQNRLVENQNLHAIKDIDYLIITTDELRSEAQRLADYHKQNSGFTTLILNPEKIYNEFSSGAKDVTAIRDFIRHLYLNASTTEKRIKYVLLFGDTSFDFKNIEENNGPIDIVAFQSVNSLDLAESFVTDDFFGMMDDNEGFFSRNANLINDMKDVATGRMPVKNSIEAKSAIDRTLSYYQKEAFGKWRSHISLVADDLDNESYNFDLQENTELIADNIKDNKPVYNITKIYADAFVQEINAGGERYPTVKEAITNAIERGSLILNYFGHGGENGWASERILDVPQVQNWHNKETLPLFITVTCEFSRLDNPNRNTAGEFLFSNANGGSVNMLTTTRAVYINSGGRFNVGLINNLLEFDTNDNLTIAESLMKTKNQNTDFRQRFFIYFFGDPAMKLPIAKPSVRITEMNDTPIDQQLDTIKALSHVYFKGIITDNNNHLIPDFNGELFVTIYDKSTDRETLNNDNYTGSPNTMVFDSRESKIFNGRASVINGEWKFDFIAPRDIRIAYGNAKLSFYSDNQIIDKSGYNTSIIIGGINEDAPEDTIGPTIKLFMNDESFVDGGNTNESPLFLAVLEDESGINTSLTAVDHDIIAILDGDATNPIIMNDFYETELNDFRKGKVKFPFRNLEVGLHTITFKSWDTYNNSSEATLNFVVVSDNDLVLDNVLNYPNPFINYTEFWFNHNKPSETLEAQVQIFTVSGRLIKTLNQTVLNNGTHSRSIVWNGLDDFGNKIGKGVYIYKLNVKVLSNGLQSEKFEKLVILQ
ncbi:MAG: type IX secretion system sortase PorU [Flavobacteriaceae bacterium]|nr:type IX secretion system sortase PorU [Flavobacteriaceae bacterium]